MNAIAAGKCLSKLWLELSNTLITLYSNSFGKNGLMPAATWRMWVMPALLSVYLSEADLILPKYSLSQI